MNDMRKDVNEIVDQLVKDINPYDSVIKAMNGLSFSDGRIIIVAIGKAAWTMASAAASCLKDREYEGAVITKYGHSQGPIANLEIFEAGHPLVDENSLKATSFVLNMTEGLCSNDTVIFLVSGGGSALFEKPRIAFKDLQNINDILLKCGADIKEINTIRKKLSEVKGGRFGQHCKPARVVSIILSDVLGDDLSTIASGPAVVDSTGIDDALSIIKKYGLPIDADAIEGEPVSELDNVENVMIGSVRMLCDFAKVKCEELGYDTTIIESDCSEDANDVADRLSSIAAKNQDSTRSLAFIVGGETTVKVTGNGLGGRNQQLALRAAKGIEGFKDTCIFAFASDGTDGPTDEAGGYVDGETMDRLKKKNIDIDAYLENNDSYHALKMIDGLIHTGPTGSNVNDAYALLIRR